MLQQNKPARSKQMNMLQATVEAGDYLIDRTQPLPRYVESHLETTMNELLHLMLADRDPEFYSKLMNTEL